ncbi:MAG TPA: SdiA-regulated domain-containing protein [Blastocatellia bacterium]|nr:SdiA-regulated domain-containing protein [Blastocatellia bacterium]
MGKELSKLFAFLLILAVALSAISGLSVQHVQSARGSGGVRVATPSKAAPVTSVDLSRYARVGRFDLPEPTRSAHPPNNLLAQEASGVTYNWDTDTLFVTGDGGTSVTQVTKTGQLIDTMTLAPGSSPQGTDFFDPEGITYVGGGKFVLVEERDRQANLFTYAAGGILRRADVQTVKLGTTIGNTGLEGLSYDPLTRGFIFVKETDPISIFQTGIDFVAGTATNGSPTATSSTNLFNPALANLADFADVFALSNLPSLNGQPDFSHLLVLSQESGQIINVDRSGTVFSRMTIVSDPGNPLSVADQTHEGMTMDHDGNLYIVSENGGGDSDHPQLWVYAPSTAPNQAPTAIALNNAVTSIPENTSTASPVKLADIVVTDDGIGRNDLTVTGIDASAFQIIGAALYLKAGVALNSTVKPGYSVAVNVDDPGVGGAPDATTNFTLMVTASTGGAASLIISEVAPWSSGNSDPSLRVDWFEVTNVGTATANIVGWRMGDDSRSFNTAVELNGVTSIAPGESVIFLETSDLAGKSAAFKTLWFGANPPANLQIGSYNGSGVGLSTGGDQVNLFDSAGAAQAGVVFGASPSGPFPTFDNGVGLNNASISRLSVAGVNGAFAAANDSAEIGSPGTIGASSLIISEVAPWSSGNSDPSLRVDWFEVTNIGTVAARIAGWKMDDDSRSFNNAVTLNGVTSIAPGESVIFLETTDLAGKSAAFKTLWFGANPPANLQIGSYNGSGVGLGTGGDQVNLFDSAGALRASVTFGASPSGPFPTFDNAAGLNNATISLLSAAGVNGAFVAANDSAEIGSPGTIGASSTPIVNIVATDANASERGNDIGAFRISRTGSTVGPLTASYTIASGLGQATSDDYTPALTGAATIPSAQSFVDITITPVKDSLVEGNESLTLTLGDTGSYDVGANKTAIVIITDALTQTISFDQPANKTFGDLPFSLSATASSGLPVSFAASGACTVNGAVVTLTGAGTCSITASQAGDSNYSPAPDISRTFSIARADTTTAIIADAPDPSVTDQQVTVNYNVAAKAPGGGAPTGTVTITDGVDSCAGTVAAGSCVLTLSTAGARTLRATYSGDANFNASSSSDEPHQVRTKVSIDDVFPGSASQGERIRMTVFGNGFTPQSKISIEGLGLTILTRYETSNRLTATVIVSANAIRSVRDVTVTNPDGGSSVKANAFIVR